jgi:hypothetical protein
MELASSVRPGRSTSRGCRRRTSSASTSRRCSTSRRESASTTSPTSSSRSGARTSSDQTGRKRCGLPAGPMSLLHRLIQGYMYPAYTGGLVTTYKSPEGRSAVAGPEEPVAVHQPTVAADRLHAGGRCSPVRSGSASTTIARLVKASRGKSETTSTPHPRPRVRRGSTTCRPRRSRHPEELGQQVRRRGPSSTT